MAKKSRAHNPKPGEVGGAPLLGFLRADTQADFNDWFKTNGEDFQADKALPKELLAALIYYGNFELDRMTAVCDSLFELIRKYQEILGSAKETLEIQMRREREVQAFQAEYSRIKDLALQRQGVAAIKSYRVRREAKLDQLVGEVIDREVEGEKFSAPQIVRRIRINVGDRLKQDSPRLKDPRAKNELDELIDKELPYKGGGLEKRVRQAAERARKDRSETRSG